MSFAIAAGSKLGCVVLLAPQSGVASWQGWVVKAVAERDRLAAEGDPQVHRLEFDGRLLERGFWLYALKIHPPMGGILVYVGRTGDSSSLNAQSPFNRLSLHLSRRPQSSALRNHLIRLQVEPERCSFELIAYGPIMPEAKDLQGHRDRRDMIAAYEAELARRITDQGWAVINRVRSRKALDAAGFESLWQAFDPHFPGPVEAQPGSSPGQHSQ